VVRGQHHAPAAVYPRERLGTHCTEGWVGPRAGLDRCGKSRPHRDSIPGPSSPQPVAAYRIYYYLFRYNTIENSFRPHYAPGVDSTSKRNEYQEYFLGGKGGRCLGMTTLPPSCADCLEIWEPQPSGALRACPGL